MTPSIPDSFKAKKHKILAALSVPKSEYFDNSPKGSVDEPIRELIDLINSYPGWCTTSSCSGRVAVFVEGPKNTHLNSSAVSIGGLEVENGDEGGGEDGDGSYDETMVITKATTTTTMTTTAKKTTKTGPGGKGGGHWLFVSHSPLTDTANIVQLNIISPEPSSSISAWPLTSTLQVVDDTVNTTATTVGNPFSQRLAHLSFSPLILHVLCASLDHARPLLAAAINAGFRESGVQSLKVLEEPEKGVMVAIRTAGLAFSTVVGVVTVGIVRPGDGEQGEQETENRRVVVSEEYLRMCLRVVNERFKGNEERKKRLEEEVRKVIGKEEQRTKKVNNRGKVDEEWETKEDRRRRKREEGLRRQKQNEEEEQRRKHGLPEERTQEAPGEAIGALLDFNMG